MSAVIVGSPISGGKVLQRQDYQRDINGLETITENYKIRTEDRLTLAPAKDTTHASFSSSSSKYARMAVETISFGEEDGGLSSMSVVYVGLTASTGLPKPVVRMIPTTGAGIYGPPLTIEIEFITDLVESEFANGQLVKGVPTNQQFTNVGLGRFLTMPSQLNGLTLPSQPRPLGVVQSNKDGNITYYGYCMDNLDSTRRGQFLVAKAVFKEKQFGIGAFAYATQV
jgi:hypothetical protein